MATLPQLIDVLAKHDGRDHATIKQFGRVIREAGYIPAGKRGAGAPRMTTHHAAILLLGIYASASPKEAPDAISRLSTLRPMGTGVAEGAPEDLAEISKAATFGEALEEAIVSAPGILGMAADHVSKVKGGTLSEESRAILMRQSLEGSGVLNFRVRISGFSAKMSLTSPWGEAYWDESFSADDDLLMEGFYPERKGDRRVSIEFGLPTLLDLFLCLSDAEGAE